MKKEHAMKQSLSTLIAGISILSINTLYSAQQTLKVKTIKDKIDVPFTAATTIAQVKEAIKESEGVPVEQQKLIKSEGWVLGLFPKILITVLEDDQTCSKYDLQPTSDIQFYLRIPKSQAEIEAELNARRETISNALLKNYLSQDPLSIVIGYDNIVSIYKS